jgi:type IV fimbrial biogenesis protein FimT
MQETPIQRSPNYMAGFSLIELMVVVAMIAIISAIATPNLRRFLVQAEVRSAVNDWTQALVLAKSEAIKQNRQVTLCPSSTGSGCTATASFEIGWIVKTGTTATVTGDRILADYFPLPRVTMTSNKNSPAVTYLANGLPIGNFAGMRITVMEAIAAPDATLTRYICIARTGRARTFTEEQWLSLPNSECS